MQTNKQIYSWAMYDWANSAYATTVMAGFFPLFFKSYFSSEADVLTSTANLGIANSLSSMIIVLMAPFLGAIADVGGYKKRFIFLFTYLGILMSGALALVQQGEWELAAFIYVLGNIGFMGSNIFNDSLLPSVAKDRSLDFVSGLGFSLGYLGGGVLFALNVLMVQKPEWFGLADMNEAVKASFVTVALWWGLFSLPLLLFVKEERPAQKQTIRKTVIAGYRQLLKTFKKIRHLKGLLLFLVAYWLYIDGVDTIIRMSVDYAMAIGFEPNSLILALLLVQFIGFPATLLFSKLAQMYDTKKALFVAIGTYLFITLWASLMQEVYEFYLLAAMIGMVQGGIQALSRSYYARMIPQEQAAEFFGFFNFLGRFATIFGPLLIGFVAVTTGSSRLGIASVSIFFVAGAVLLYFVNEEKIATEVKQTLL
ncbi:MAG: MFS transporter [Helicobacteraceae bacterium]|jgi:UMF1 family MFS transporter|nr:MFS transporter [Helicobacteraceae bacterium]